MFLRPPKIGQLHASDLPIGRAAGPRRKLNITAPARHIGKTDEEGDREERRTYTSPAILARRKRIVEKAHEILGEGGVDALTIRRLAAESDVAPRTIYRLFGDKDGVILATVSDRMAEVRAQIAANTSEYTLERVFHELDWMISEMERDTEYGRVVVGFVFWMEPRRREVRELLSVAYSRFRNWLEREIEKGNVRHDLDRERIANVHVMHEYLVYRRWTLGVVGSHQARLELRACFLQTASVLLVGKAYEDCMKHLAELHAKLDPPEPLRWDDPDTEHDPQIIDDDGEDE